jgi:hypothetical protein
MQAPGTRPRRYGGSAAIRIDYHSYMRIRNILDRNRACTERRISDYAVQSNADDGRFLAEMKEKTAQSLTPIMVQKAYTTVHHQASDWCHILISEATFLSPQDHKDIMEAAALMSNDLDSAFDRLDKLQTSHAEVIQANADAITELDEADQRIALLEVQLQEAKDSLAEAEQGYAEMAAGPDL